MKIPNTAFTHAVAVLSLARIVSEDSQRVSTLRTDSRKSSKDS